MMFQHGTKCSGSRHDASAAAPTKDVDYDAILNSSCGLDCFLILANLQYCQCACDCVQPNLSWFPAAFSPALPYDDAPWAKKQMITSATNTVTYLPIHFSMAETEPHSFSLRPMYFAFGATWCKNLLHEQLSVQRSVHQQGYQTHPLEQVLQKRHQIMFTEVRG